MKLVDPALPAVQHLVSDGAIDVLRPPVEASGGILHAVHPVDVQYRPGSDVVVRYTAHISWGRGEPERETLVAASTMHGTHPGTISVTAETATGMIDIGVWRWPFDPVLRGLAAVVTAKDVAALIDHEAPSELTLSVVSYRPTQRAVVQVSSAEAPVAYLKVVAPERTSEIVHRHERLRAAGVPAPEVLDAHVERGILVLRPLIGPTLRDMLKTGRADLPAPERLQRLTAALASSALETPGPPSRLADGVLHAQMLASVLPARAAQLDELAARFGEHTLPDRDSTIHGDLHEGQLVVVDGEITGLLDLDDAGVGAEVDDWANMIARLRFRTIANPFAAAELNSYGDQLTHASRDRFDIHELDLHIAACLVGLATGPFRIQSNGWRDIAGELLDLADSLSMRNLSAPSHSGFTSSCAH